MLKKRSKFALVLIAPLTLLTLGACSSLDIFSARDEACNEVLAADYVECIKTWRDARQSETDASYAEHGEILAERSENDARQAERAILNGKGQ